MQVVTVKHVNDHAKSIIINDDKISIIIDKDNIGNLKCY